MTNYEKVQHFNALVAQLKESAGLEPTSINTQMKLITEEYHEVINALFDWENSSASEVYNTQLALQKELLDLLYVTYGLLSMFKGNVDAGFDAVHTNNMNKFNGATFREDGKLIKPEGFVKMTDEDLARALYDQ